MEWIATPSTLSKFSLTASRFCLGKVLVSRTKVLANWLPCFSLKPATSVNFLSGFGPRQAEGGVDVVAHQRWRQSAKKISGLLFLAGAN